MQQLINKKYLFLATALIFAFTLAGVAQGQGASSSDTIRVFIAFDGPVDQTEWALIEAFGGDIRYSYNLVDAVAATIPETALPGLERHPLISRIELDGTVEMLNVEYDATWSVGQIGADVVHDNAVAPVSTGAEVKIGIIDSGANYEHPDLAGNFDMTNAGYDFFNYDHDPMDVYGHGTHVTGSACASANGFGVVGVAPDCELYALRVHSDDGVAYWSDIIAAVDYATGAEIYLPEYWDTDVGAPTTTITGPKLDIINLSLGKSADPGETVKQSFDAAYYEHDLLIVAAAGNSGNRGGNNDSVIYPAKFDSVIAVGATDDKNQRASWSSTGPALEIVAPGDGVYSTWNDEESYADPQPVCTGELVDINGDGERDGECYKYGAGTSMAAPHVAGVAALMIAADKAANSGVRTKSAADLRAILQTTATPLGNSNEYGNGLVNAVAAVEVVTGSGSEEEEPPSNTAPVADFTYSVTDLTVDFTDASTDNDGDSTITSRSWNFGDNNDSTEKNPTYTYGAGGTYSVSLVVTDDAGATSTAVQDVTVTESSTTAGVVLTANGYKDKGLQKVSLSWSGATANTVDVYRDGILITTTANDGVYTDDLNERGGGSYVYQVCEAGNVTACSTEATVTF